MTRFLLSLDRAVDVVFAAVSEAKKGETYIPRSPSARTVDIADAMIGSRNIRKNIIGIRPGEKCHEILISEEECFRTIIKEDYYVILPIVPELRQENLSNVDTLDKEYSSADNIITLEKVKAILEKNKLMVDDPVFYPNEV